MLACASSAWPGAVSAQPITNVNECTFITDPVALKRCIDGFQLRGPTAQYPQSAPIPPIETPAQAERERDNSRLPPNASYRDAPEWLGTKDAGSPADKPDPRVLDLTKE